MSNACAGKEEEEDEDGFDLGPLQEELLRQILAAKRGATSTMPSAFLEEDMFEDPYTIEEIKSDPKKHILWAAEHNKLQEAQTLLTSDPSLVNSRDEDLYTPLHRASYNDHVDMMRLLVTNGADIHAYTVDGWQPFHSACRWGNLEAAKFLISKGADVNCLTIGNNSALHLAAVNGEAESTIKFLIENTDIDTSTVNTGGDTAENIAKRNSQFAKYFHRKSPAENTEKCNTIAEEVASQPRRVVIVPGNGGGNVYHCNWYGWLYKTLTKSGNQHISECRLENMPDPVVASENIWLPFMEKELQCDANTIIVGHRYAENHKVFAIVLVSAYVSDLGDETECASGYFNRPWQWDRIKSNCQHIVQFGSKDDPFLPWEEQELIAKETGAEFHADDRCGHYMNSVFPELMKVITKLVEPS